VEIISLGRNIISPPLIHESGGWEHIYREILTVDDTLKELKKLREETCDVFAPHFYSPCLRTRSMEKRSKHCAGLADQNKAFNINEIVECQHPDVPAGCLVQVAI
jgi:hypothetical protein